jgi:hypothetical protein
MRLEAPRGGPLVDAAFWKGPEGSECPYVFFFGNDFQWRCQRLEINWPFGASDLAEVLTGFLQNAGRLIHWVAFAHHPETSEKWCETTYLSFLDYERWEPRALIVPPC